MKRTLYLITLYCRTEPEGHIPRNVRIQTDRGAIAHAIEWLRSYRIAHSRNPNLCDTWTVYDVEQRGEPRFVAKGDMNGVLTRVEPVAALKRPLPRN